MISFESFFKIIWKFITILLNFSPEKKESWDRFVEKIKVKAEKHRLLKGLYLLLERFYHRKYISDDKVLSLFKPSEQVLNSLILLLSIVMAVLVPVLPSLFLPLVMVIFSVALGLVVSNLQVIRTLYASLGYLLLPFLLVSFSIPVAGKFYTLHILILFLFLILIFKSPKTPDGWLDYLGVLLFTFSLSRPFYFFIFSQYNLLIHVGMGLGGLVLYGLLSRVSFRIRGLNILCMAFFLGFIFQASSDAYTLFFTNLFYFLAPLWFFVGVGVMFKVLGNTQVIYNTLDTIFTPAVLKRLLYGVLGVVILLRVSHYLGLFKDGFSPNSALGWTLGPLGFIAFLFMAYLGLIKWYKEVEEGLETRLLFLFLLGLFLIFQYYRQLFAVGGSTQGFGNKPVLFAFLIITFTFLFIKMGIYSLQRSITDATRGKFVLLLSAVLLFALAFHTFYLNGNPAMLTHFFHHLFLGILHFGIPFGFFLFYAKERESKPVRFFHYFLGGCGFLLVGELLRKWVKLGSWKNLLDWSRGVNAEIFKAQGVSLPYEGWREFLILYLVPLLLMCLLIYFARRNWEPANAGLYIFFLLSGAASMAFYAMPPDPLNIIYPNLQYILFPTRPVVTLSAYFFLQYMIFLVPALVLYWVRNKHLLIMVPVSLGAGTLCSLLSFGVESFHLLLSPSRSVWLLISLGVTCAVAGWATRKRWKALRLLSLSLLVICVFFLVRNLLGERMVSAQHFNDTLKIPKVYSTTFTSPQRADYQRRISKIPVLQVSLYNPRNITINQIHQLWLKSGFKPVGKRKRGEYDTLVYQNSEGGFRILAFSMKLNRIIAFSYQIRFDWIDHEVERVLSSNGLTY